MRRIVLAILLAGGALSLAAARLPDSQGSPQEPKVVQMLFLAGIKKGDDPLKLNSMFSDLYLLVGGGRHAVMLGTDDGVVLVDTKLRGWGQPLLDKIKLVTDNPVTTIINTSPLGAGSNSEFPTVVDIVAHEHTKANLARMDAFKGQNARFLPNKTYQDKLSLVVKTVGEFNGTNRIDLYYFGPGHTNGDTIVVFPSFGVAFLGDLFPAKATPVIDTSNGGSAVALPDTLAKAVAEIKDVDLVVPGRATPPAKAVIRWMTMKDLQEYADFNRDFLAAVRDAMKAGKTVDEAAAGLKMPEKYKDYGMEHAKANVQAIYDELKK